MLRRLLFVIALVLASAPLAAQIRTIGGAASGTTFPLLGANGTAAAPSYSFTNSAGLGLYRFGADTLGFATSGVARMFLLGNGLRPATQIGLGSLALPWDAIESAAQIHTSFDGFATNPALRLGSNNTGLYSVTGGTDTLGITLNNTANIKFAGGASASIIGGAGNMTILAGTGNSRNMLLQATNGSGIATTAITAKFDTVRIHDEVVLPSLTAASGTPNSVCMNATSKQVTENAATSCVVSSRRFKQNILPLTDVVAQRITTQLKPSVFKYRVGGRNAIGLIAEEADSVDSRLATRDGQGRINSVNYEQVTVVLLKQVQGLTAKLDRMCKAGIREAC